ncbi:TRNA dimethylallyltransferase, mitochondrial [Aphelenchoides fujianensis]|nr:TRNA dimethylallyltransferase, mitochondrial [Aphelenchoides fujianensis]
MLKLLRSIGRKFAPPMTSAPPSPLIVVAGCTGTGKSDLGVAIAQRFNGEIISADSMQIYKGLDIVTNKITPDEAKGVPHHLVSFVDAQTDDYNVHLFQRDALRLIDEIRARNRLPILVGGTAYYIEAVMYRDALVQLENHEEAAAKLRPSLRKKSAGELYRQLQELDSEAARRVHPNNHFRVLRALEIYLASGGKKSDLHGAQKTLRFPQTLLLILDADAEVLDARLDKRVEKMKERNVLQELDDYFQQHKSVLGAFGVKQSIGIKEFAPYLQLSAEERAEEASGKLLQKCFDDLKLHTRQYSRKQRSWFVQRFLRRGKLREVPNCMVLNTSTDFFEGVVPFALDRVDEFLRIGSVLQTEGPFVISNRFPRIDDEEYAAKANAVLFCDTCGIHVHGADQFEKHLNGKVHRRGVREAEKRKAAELNAKSVSNPPESSSSFT